MGLATLKFSEFVHPNPGKLSITCSGLFFEPAVASCEEGPSSSDSEFEGAESSNAEDDPVEKEPLLEPSPDLMSQ